MDTDLVCWSWDDREACSRYRQGTRVLMPAKSAVFLSERRSQRGSRREQRDQVGICGRGSRAGRSNAVLITGGDHQHAEADDLVQRVLDARPWTADKPDSVGIASALAGMVLPGFDGNWSRHPILNQISGLLIGSPPNGRIGRLCGRCWSKARRDPHAAALHRELCGNYRRHTHVPTLTISATGDRP